MFKVPSKGEKYYFVASLAKGLRILELLATHGDMSASRMAAHLSTSRAASHRFLTTLRDLGYVEKTEEGRFSLSFRVLDLGMKKLESFEIRHTVHPFMQEIALAFGETVNFGHWDGRAIVHLDKINSTEIFRLDVGMGAAAPAYCTGLGKAVLSFLDDSELDAYLESVELIAMSPKTITNPQKLKADIARIRKRGYAIDDEEYERGMRCIAAVVYGHSGAPIAALMLSGPSTRISISRLTDLAQQVQSAALDVSH